MSQQLFWAVTVLSIEGVSTQQHTLNQHKYDRADYDSSFPLLLTSNALLHYSK
jgi:hypothetical protein